MRLAPEGLREWGSATIVTALAIAPLWVWCPVIWLNWVVTGVVGALWVFVVQFFRDPTRHPPKTIRPGDFLSPADGVVSAVLRVDSHEAVEGRAARKSMPMGWFESRPVDREGRLVPTR